MVQVVFEASKTNAIAAPQEEKPKRKAEGPLLIAVFNGAGFAWILSDRPLIAAVMAACVAGVSLSMRQSRWLRDGSWILSCAVACALIVYPPSIPTKLRSVVQQQRPIEDLRKEQRAWDTSCKSTGLYYDCWRRQTLARQISDALYAPAKTVPEPDALADQTQTAILCALAWMLLFAVHKVAGEPDEAPSAPPPAPAKPPEDPEAKLKRDGLNKWLRFGGIVLGGTDVTPVDKVFDEYRKYLSSEVVTPPMYNPEAFKKAFSAAANREPEEIKGVWSYVGVSFSGGGLA